MMDKEEIKNRETKETGSIEVIEENLRVEKEKINTGRVRISKKVLEEDVPIDLIGFQEDIEIERKKIGRVVDKPGPAIRNEGDFTIYSLYKEVYVKQTILEEEVKISKKITHKSFEGKEKLRKEILDIERTKPSEEN